MAQFIFVGSPVPEIEFLGTADSPSNDTSYSFTNRSLGTATSDRLIVVAATGRTGSDRDISSVSIAGSNGTQIVQRGNEGSTPRIPTGLFQRIVPSGTTGTITVNWSGGVNNCVIGWWSIKRYKSATPTASDSDIASSSSVSLALNVLKGGAVISAAALIDDFSFSLSGVDEDFDDPTDSATSMIGGHRTKLSADAAYDVTGSGFVGTRVVLVGASWR